MSQPQVRNSDLSQIAVNANNIPEDTIDCGVLGLGWCRGPTCQKYARLRTFILTLGLAGLLQGACETYFRISAKQAAVEYNYDPLIVDWLLVSSGIFQGIFALGFAHWAQRFHPIKWLAGALMLQSAACILVLIPGAMNFTGGVKQTDALLDANFCTTTYQELAKIQLTAEQSSTLTLAMLFVLQLGLGMGSLAYYTIGVSYIDDNSISVDSPAVIAATLGARIFGMQLGSFLVLGVGFVSVGWWLGWAVLAPLVFVSAVLLGLFPKRLPKTVIHTAAQRIIEESNARRFGSHISTYIDDSDFWPTAKRLFANKLLMFNLVSVMFLQAASLNYALQEESYLQSRFYLPYNEQDGLTQEWEASFVSYFLKPPVMAVGMLIGGLIISKVKLSARTIAGINISLGLHLIAIYVGFIFIKCDVGPIAGIEAGKLNQPYCSRACLCTPTAFLPVCPENSTVTYFTPCYAGCHKKTAINSVEIYEGCSCQSDYNSDLSYSIRATAGACSAAKCQKMIIVYQIMSLSAAAMLGMMLIGKIIITLRSVLPQDKCMALAYEVMYVGIIAYVPTHLAFYFVTRSTCVYWAPEYKRCLLQETPLHGNILNIIAACLILVAVLFDILVFIFTKGLNIYNCKVTDVNYTPSLYSAVPHDDPQSPTPLTIHNAIGGSPVTTTTTSSPLQRRDTRVQQEQQPQSEAAQKPHQGITVFRNPSSTTTSSGGGQSIVPPSESGVTYAQVVFPPDRHKPKDGNASPKRLAVPANVPLHHLTEQDVRSQLSTLKSFGGDLPTTAEKVSGGADISQVRHVETPPPSQPPSLPSNSPPASVTSASPPPTETNLDHLVTRPQSPETDF